MGRHEALQPSLSQKVGQFADLAFDKTPINRPHLPKLKKHFFRPLWGFLFSVSFILVTIVDPYSGTIASASTMSSFDFNGEQDPTQTYGYASTQKILFTRGGFNIVTGSDAAAMFVESASAPSPGTAKAFAYSMLTGMKLGEDQYSCLVKLWTRESNWNVNAANKSSGAYGIPQALPGSKMSTEGADWLTNPETQIRWGVKYIQARFGAPCGALAHSDKFGWY
jgi:hypothetical protein